ncbi:MAG: ribonuclease P protein component [Urechidicola sp.]
MRFTLGKEEKLKSRKQIERLFLEGESVKEFPLRLKFLKTDYELKFPFQVAFSVPKRNVKLAVDRIRIKRLLREVYRKNKHIILNNNSENYVVMFIYTDKKERKYEELEIKMISVLNKFVAQQQS